jgi:hypothetical protein
VGLYLFLHFETFLQAIAALWASWQETILILIYYTCNGGVDRATMSGLGPGSRNIVSTSWSPTSSSMSMAPGGQFGECVGDEAVSVDVEWLVKALMVPLSEAARPPPPFVKTPDAEQSVDWLRFGCRRLLAIRSSRFDRYMFHKNKARNKLRPIATVSEMKRMNFSLLSLMCLYEAKKSATNPTTKLVSLLDDFSSVVEV